MTPNHEHNLSEFSSYPVDPPATRARDKAAFFEKCLLAYANIGKRVGLTAVIEHGEIEAAWEMIERVRYGVSARAPVAFNLGAADPLPTVTEAQQEIANALEAQKERRSRADDIPPMRTGV